MPKPLFSFFHCGAGVVQICSAVQNQDFTVIQDYIIGLKTYLYVQSRTDMASWDGQSPPSGAVPSIGNIVGRGLPKFGPYAEKRRKFRSEDCLKRDLLAVQSSPQKAIQTVKPSSVNEQVGRALTRIGNYNDLDNKQQAVAVVDEELCINCGKCYMTCNDSGYQAIVFDPSTHIPTVTDDCTGCTLCVSVCPVIDCITMVPRKTPYVPFRGIDVKM